MKRALIILVSSLVPLSAFATKFTIEQWQTKNGSQVLFYQSNEIPMIDIKVAFKAGSAFDNKQWGMASLTGSLIDQGTASLTATQIAEQFENYGAIFSSDVDKDKATFSLRLLSHRENIPPVLDTFKKLLSEPSFTPQNISRQKQQLLTTINYMDGKPASLANNAFYKSLYSAHPYGHSVYGTKTTVSRISKLQIQTFFQTHYTASNATIAIVGDLSTYEAKKISNKLSQKFQKTTTKSPTVPVISRTQQAYSKNIDFPSTQTNILIGQIGIDHKNPNYFPLIVGNYTLGGSGLISQLAEEVREKRGLTYGVYSTFKTLATPGPFTISLATKNSQTPKALDVTLKTLNHFLSQGPTDKELKAAKQYLTGSFPLKLSSNKSIANTLLNIGFYGLPNDYIETYLNNIDNVKKEDIKMAFKQVIDPNALTTITVGKL